MDMELGLKIKKTREASKSAKLTKDSIPIFTSHETETLYILVGYLSGYLKGNIGMMIDGGGSLLTINGEKLIEEMVIVKWGMYRKKIEPRRFQKVFRIPESVDVDRIKARFDEEEGILRVFMPKINVGEFSGIWIQEVDDEAADAGTRNVAIEMEKAEDLQQSPETFPAEDDEDDYHVGGMEGFPVEEDDTESCSGDKMQLMEEEEQIGPEEMVRPEIAFPNEEKEVTNLEDNSEREQPIKIQTVPSKPREDQGVPQEMPQNKGRVDGNKGEVCETVGKDTLGKENKGVQAPESPVRDTKLSGAPCEEKLHKPDLPNPPSTQASEQENSGAEISEKDQEKQQCEGERERENIEEIPGGDMPSKEMCEISTDDKNEDLPEAEQRTTMKDQSTQTPVWPEQRTTTNDQSTQTPVWPRKRCNLYSPWLYVSSTIALLMVVVVQLSKDKRKKRNV
ncbi:uncharacterized protein LOC116264193 [Nymphaea colorata]|nr:uncharacterized protein LOC116264193 [Nymphaea colorata]